MAPAWDESLTEHDVKVLAARPPKPRGIDFGPRPALLIIDMQKAFDDPVWQPRNNPEAEAIAGRLLAAWRDSRRLVIHVEHLSREPGSSYRPDGPGVEFKDEVRPRAGGVKI